jgi:outer membrane protein OmpA-like peptidoglycan-associated protein
MNRLITILLVLGLGSSANAQSADITTFFMSNSRKAEIYYEKLAYENAIELYERVLAKNPADLNAQTRIAECYIKLNNPRGVVSWYRPIIENPSLMPIHKYNYAQALTALGNYEEAKTWYENYKQDVPDDPRSDYKLKFLEDLDFYTRDSSLYLLTNLQVNSENSEFGAVEVDNELIFLSSRDQALFIKYEDDDENEFSQAPFDIYISTFTDSSFSQPKKLHQVINTKFHEGPMTFYNDYSKVIFTRSNYYSYRKGESEDGKIKLKLYSASLNPGGEWSNVKPFVYNDNEYSTAHPSLSADNLTLYFTSDRPGGFGGNDIYFCQRIDNSWSEPVNAGGQVNTAGDEFFPFISEDGHLYFSSNGHGGFGGLDIYRSTRFDGQFGNIENLGFPMNTSGDDFSFSIGKDGRKGFISSNRPGGKGSDDIYQFEVRYKSIVGRVLESRTKEFVGNAEIMINDSARQTYTILKADESGYFQVDLPLDTYFDLQAKKDNFGLEVPTRISTVVHSFQTDTADVFMWRHELFAQGRIFSNETQELLPDVTVSLENLTQNTFTILETKEDGKYVFVLKPDQLYIIQAEKIDHVTSNFKLNTEGMIADTLLNDFVLEEVYVTKDVIFFDFNKAIIKPDAQPALNQMITNLKRHKDTYIVVSAHADAQGTFEYNLTLSNRRALAVVAYLKQKGIREDRITWRGFGEQLLINRCSDGVQCQEEEHSKNRRAELKIEKSKN